MTNNAQSHLRDIGEAYVKHGYPDRQTWPLKPTDEEGARAFRELAALGYVEQFTITGEWILTSSGLRWVLNAHPMTEEAKALFRTIRDTYIKAGYPDRQAWYVERNNATSIAPFQELDARGFIEPCGTGYKMWFLTEGGLQTMLKDGGA